MKDKEKITSALNRTKGEQLTKAASSAAAPSSSTTIPSSRANASIKSAAKQEAEFAKKIHQAAATVGGFKAFKDCITSSEVDINARDDEARTPLMTAIIARNEELVELLLGERAIDGRWTQKDDIAALVLKIKLNTPDKKGDTALHHAVRAACEFSKSDLMNGMKRFNSISILKLLLKNPYILLSRKNEEKLTPKGIANAMGDDKVKELMKKAIEKRVARKAREERKRDAERAAVEKPAMKDAKPNQPYVPKAKILSVTSTIGANASSSTASSNPSSSSSSSTTPAHAPIRRIPRKSAAIAIAASSAAANSTAASSVAATTVLTIKKPNTTSSANGQKSNTSSTSILDSDDNEIVMKGSLYANSLSAAQNPVANPKPASPKTIPSANSSTISTAPVIVVTSPNPHHPDPLAPTSSTAVVAPSAVMESPASAAMLTSSVPSSTTATIIYSSAPTISSSSSSKPLVFSKFSNMAEVEAYGELYKEKVDLFRKTALTQRDALIRDTDFFDDLIKKDEELVKAQNKTAALRQKVEAATEKRFLTEASRLAELKRKRLTDLAKEEAELQAQLAAIEGADSVGSTKTAADEMGGTPDRETPKRLKTGK